MSESTDSTRLPLPEPRKRRLNKVQDALDENTRTGAIDKSAEIATHTVSYLEDELEEELQAIADDRTPSRHLDADVAVDVTVK